MYHHTISVQDPDVIRAAKKNDFQGIASAFLDNTDPNVADKNGNTALIYLAQHGNVAGIELMRASGAHVDHVNKTGDSALHIALIAHHPKAAHALIEAGADTNLANASGLTGLQMMARAGDRKGVNTNSPRL